MRAGFRAIGAGELGAVAEMAAGIWRECYPGMISMAQIEYMLARMYAPGVLQGELTRGVTWEWLVLEDRPAGFVSWEPTGGGRGVHLNKLYLQRRWQGRGWGQAMLERVRSAAEAEGAGWIELRVNRANQPALKAYRRAGYQRVGSLVEDIGGGFVMDDHRLRLDLETGPGKRRK